MLVKDCLDLPHFYQALEDIIVPQVQFANLEEPFSISFRLVVLKNAMKLILTSPSSVVPSYWHGRHTKANLELIETALIISRLGIMSLKEIKYNVLLYEILTRHYASNVVVMSHPKSIETLLESIRFVNRTMSPSFVFDWCLRCAEHLESTEKLFKQNVLPANLSVMNKKQIKRKIEFKTHQ